MALERWSRCLGYSVSTLLTMSQLHVGRLLHHIERRGTESSHLGQLRLEVEMEHKNLSEHNFGRWTLVDPLAKEERCGRLLNIAERHFDCFLHWLIERRLWTHHSGKRLIVLYLEPPEHKRVSNPTTRPRTVLCLGNQRGDRFQLTLHLLL